MKHSRLKISFMLVLYLTASIPFMVQAEGLIQLPKTGQTTCYDASGNLISCAGTGQDGEIQAGEAWPAPRFTPGTGAELECMTDNLTGLMWPKNGNLPNETKTWEEAIDYPKTMTLCGHSDWRLPNINELESLVNVSQFSTAAWLNTQGFSNVQLGFSGCYWSSSTYAGNTGYAGAIYMSYGSTGYDVKSNSHLVWPVRSTGTGPPGNTIIWQTGQTASYRNGDDGDLKQGVSWPSPRFSDEGSGEVTDNLTGLVWTKDGNSPGPSACSPTGTKNWQGALDYVKCLNVQNYLGHNDWRLPNMKELRSLLDYSRMNPVLPLGNPFMNIQLYYYWSSTSNIHYTNTSSSAWVLGMNNGMTTSLVKSSNYFSVWPVREGQVRPILTLTITKSGIGSGSITIDTGSISWNGNTGTVSFYSGTSVTLTPHPGIGSFFSGWSGGGCSGTSCVITVDADKLVSATFSTVTGGMQLPRTGQTTCRSANGDALACYGTGQDGEIRAGVSWPNPRFTDNGDQTITDNLTGLVWTKNCNAPGPTTCVPGTTKSWQDALNYVQCLNATGNGYLGYTDWRLPNINELESLVNAEQSNIGSWLGSQGFTNNLSQSYWSSSSRAGYESYAQIVFLLSGELGIHSKSNAHYVWPVRAGQSGSSVISLPKTGQTACYDTSGSSIACAGTGQDGELQMGAAWPGTGFTDNGDQTIIDNLTGLVWAKNVNVLKTRDPGFDNDSGPGTPGDGAVTWQHALDYIQKLNREGYLGYNDWRLPNRKEGGSLWNYGQSDNITWWKSQGFTNIEENNGYWSSSSLAYSHPMGPAAWELAPGYSPKFYSRVVWPLRAGQVRPIVTLTVTKTGKGSGSVTTDTGTIVWNGNTGTVSYYGGTSVTLTATPDPGLTFAGWSGGCSGRGACSIILNANTQATADFSVKGDVDSDGGVNLADAIMALQVISHMTPAQTVNKGADVDGDGKIGLAEAIYILQKAAEMRQN